ncbi:MAG: LPS assembly lipoprotein LptE [Planctomycetota bacterium]
MKRRPLLLVAAALIFASISAPGCGYSSSLRVAERYPSVGLEFFDNDSFERDLERPLHDELSRALRNMSDARLVEPGKADAVVKGRIILYNRRGGIRSPDNVLLETGVRIDVEAALYVRGQLEPSRKERISKAVGYTLDDPNNETEARNRALRHIAEEVVLTLLAPVN